jgi:hypothetical protein
MDYRLKQNRREAFIRWFVWSLEYKDCDPAVWLANYLNERFEHNDEQKLWFSWLYGNTYYLPTAWILLNEFPDFELATVDRMEKWNNENYKRLRYQVDTKWNKGHLPQMFESYQQFIGNQSQRSKFESLLRDNPSDSFDSIWESVKGGLHKFGRYSTWFYLQQLHHTAGVHIEPTSLMLDDYNGSRSHRNGLLYTLGQEENIDRKLELSHIRILDDEAREILREIQERYPHLKDEANFFTMETCLCSFKKLFRAKHGRYLGYYNDRVAEEIKKVEADGWYGIDWDVLWQARDENLDHRMNSKNGINKENFTYFLNTGKMSNLEWMFNDEEVPVIGLEMFT